MADKNRSTDKKEIEDKKNVLDNEKLEFDLLKYVDNRLPPSLDFTLRGGVFLR